MKKALFLILSILFAGCNLSENKNINENKKKEMNYLINHSRNKAALSLKKTNQLIPIGTGEQRRDNIEMLAISFIYKHKMEIEESRKLLITAVDALTMAINKESRIHPYLRKFPFLPRNAEIRIFFRTPKNPGKSA